MAELNFSFFGEVPRPLTPLTLTCEHFSIQYSITAVYITFFALVLKCFEDLLVVYNNLLIFQQTVDVGGVVVGHYLLHQYLEERKQLFSLKANRNRLLEQKVRNDRGSELGSFRMAWGNT